CASAFATSSGLIRAGGVKPARLRVLSEPCVVSITVVPFCRPFTRASALAFDPAQEEYCDATRRESSGSMAASAGMAVSARAAAAMRIMASSPMAVTRTLRPAHEIAPGCRPAVRIMRTSRLMKTLIVVTLAIGLIVDQHWLRFGQEIVSVAVWGLLAVLWFRANPRLRPAFVACLLIATAGEC